MNETQDNGPTPDQIQGISLPLLAANPYLILVQKYWKLALFGIMLLFMGYQHMRINFLKQEVKTEQANVEAANQRYAACDSKMTDIGNKIKDLSSQSKSLNDQLKDLQPALGKIQKSTDRAVIEILKDNAPKTCEQVNDYILKNQDDFGWGDI